MIGVPSLSVTQPGRSGEPTRIASRLLLPAIPEVAASKSIGASWRARPAGAVGLGVVAQAYGQLFEDLGQRPSECRVVDQHLILLVNLGPLEDHHSLLAQCLWTYLVRLRPLFEAR